jgi:hypothetical protein
MENKPIVPFRFALEAIVLFQIHRAISFVVSFNADIYPSGAMYPSGTMYHVTGWSGFIVNLQ